MSRQPIGVAVVGFGWMGAVHTQAYVRLRHHFRDLPPARLVAVAEAEADRRTDAVDRFGFERAVTDWREIVADPDVQAVSVTAPNALHREIGAAVAEAGKHLWFEKPVGLNAADTRAVADAVHRAGVSCTVGFNYRNAPAVVHARELITSGALGSITHARFRLFADYASHPSGALSWRFERALGGPGVLGDLASHGIDLVRHLLGDLREVVADTAVFIPQRPRPTGAGSHYARVEGGELSDVENEDFMCAMLRTTAGARIVLEASRVAVGEQNNYGFEIHGTKGLVRWDFRRMGELEVSVGEDYVDQAVTTVMSGPLHGAYSSFQPGSAISMGYDDLKVIEAAAFFSSILEGKPHGATVDDAVASAVALEAIIDSAEGRRWTQIGS